MAPNFALGGPSPEPLPLPSQAFCYDDQRLVGNEEDNSPTANRRREIGLQLSQTRFIGQQKSQTDIQELLSLGNTYQQGNN